MPHQFRAWIMSMLASLVMTCSDSSRPLEPATQSGLIIRENSQEYRIEIPGDGQNPTALLVIPPMFTAAGTRVVFERRDRAMDWLGVPNVELMGTTYHIAFQGADGKPAGTFGAAKLLFREDEGLAMDFAWLRDDGTSIGLIHDAYLGMRFQSAVQNTLRISHDVKIQLAKQLAGFALKEDLPLANTNTDPIVKQDGSIVPCDEKAPVTSGNLAFSSITQTSLTVTWNAASDETTVQSALKYRLVKAASSTDIDSLSKALNRTGSDVLVDWTSNTLSRSVTGLTAGSSYHFAVVVKDESGNQSLYPVGSTTTSSSPSATAPTTGTALSATQTTNNSITMSWGAASDTATATASLQYKMVRAASSAAIDTVAEADAITGSSLVLDWTANTLSSTAWSLDAGTSYFFAVLVKNNAGLKSLYTPVSAATVAFDPADPTADPTLRDIVAVGNRHSCFVLSGGVLKCVGLNSSGQLGDGTTTTRSAPVQAATQVIKAYAGYNHSCAIMSNETVKCWGSNTAGQLGTGDKVSQSSPVTVSGLSSVKQLALGESHSCALLASGSISCWGANTSGQLGDGSNTERLTPTAVSGITTAVSIDTQKSHSCAVLSDDTVRCWGANSESQLGNASTSNSNVPVDPGLSNVLSVSAGEEHSCAVISGGTASCWGDGLGGKIGNGTSTDSNVPLTVTEVANGISLVVARGDRSCFALAAGGIKCMGFGGQGQLGQGSAASSATAVNVSGVTAVITGMKGNQDHSCFRTSAGTFRCWGYNDNYQVGNGTTTQANAPVDVQGL